MQFAAIHKQSAVHLDSLNNFPNTLRLVTAPSWTREDKQSTEDK